MKIKIILLVLSIVFSSCSVKNNQLDSNVTSPDNNKIDNISIVNQNNILAVDSLLSNSLIDSTILDSLVEYNDNNPLSINFNQFNLENKYYLDSSYFWDKNWEVVAGDFNNDGIADILFDFKSYGNLNETVGSWAYLSLGNGDESFSKVDISKPIWLDKDFYWDKNWHITCGDYDSDGNVDLLYDFKNYENSNLPVGEYAFIAKGNGDGTFDYLAFDNDGKVDLLSSFNSYRESDGLGTWVYIYNQL